MTDKTRYRLECADQTTRIEMVVLYLTTDLTAAVVAAMCGVTERTLRRWVRAYRDSVAMAGRRQA